MIKKLLILVIFLFVSYQLHARESICTERETIKNVTNEQRNNDLYECKENERKNKEFNNWIKVLDKEGNNAYVLLKDTIYCFSKKRFIDVYNHILLTNGEYTTKFLNSKGCSEINTNTIARIVEKEEDSNVVKIQYLTDEYSSWNKSYEVNINYLEGYTIISSLIPYKRYKGVLAK